MTYIRSNRQDALKLLALIFMLIDHAGLYLFPEALWMRVAGRFAVPIFTFYAGYNFKGSIRHLIWILGIILVLATKVFFAATFSNILISIAVGQLYLKHFGDRILNDNWMFFRHFLAMLIFTPFTFVFMDYGTLAIAFMQIGYLLTRKEKGGYLLILSAICLMIFTQLIYDFEEILPFIWMIFFISISVLLLYRANHKEPIGLNINFISRNMLYIYFVTTLGLMISSYCVLA